jgi:uncharacterized membrane protein YesL
MAVISGYIKVSLLMKNFRFTSLICFAIAMVCYLLAWVPGVLGFSVVGAFFEVVAWVTLFSRKGAQASPSAEPGDSSRGKPWV